MNQKFFAMPANSALYLPTKADNESMVSRQVANSLLNVWLSLLTVPSFITFLLFERPMTTVVVAEAE